jgi:hypothetical protein
MPTYKSNLPVWDCFIALTLIPLFSIPLQAATVMLGDFEGSMNGWISGNGDITAYSIQGVTQESGTLQATFPSGRRTDMWLLNNCTETSIFDLDGNCVVNFYDFLQFA